MSAVFVTDLARGGLVGTDAVTKFVACDAVFLNTGDVAGLGIRLGDPRPVAEFDRCTAGGDANRFNVVSTAFCTGDTKTCPVFDNFDAVLVSIL